MARIVWEDRKYLRGLDRGVFYDANGIASAWDGLISVRTTSESNTRTLHVDGQSIRQNSRGVFLAGTIEAVNHPLAFYEEPIFRQRVPSFSMSFRTNIVKKPVLHIIYDILVSTPTKTSTVNSVERYSWNYTTKPIALGGVGYITHLMVDTSIAYPWAVAALEDVLYGTDSLAPHLPSPEEVYQIIEDASILKVTDHGDGSFTVDGPDSAIVMLDATSFEITWPSAIIIDAESYQISSL